MVTLKEKFKHLPDGQVDLENWLATKKEKYPLPGFNLIDKASHLAKDASTGLTTFYGQPCIEQGMEMAEIVFALGLDAEAIAAAILLSSFLNTKLTAETIAEKVDPNISKLLLGIQKMDVIHNLQKNLTKSPDQTQIDRFRKLLLGMVSDIRVVIIKLAERTCVMRGIKGINPTERKFIAQETMDIYAPLANRLGIGQLKWELEDIAFHYSNPETYKTIAKFLAEKRLARENQIHAIIDKLKNALAEVNIKADISGRAKHIYSIYLKAQRKKTPYEEIYDYSAIRILVPTLQDCFTALSIAHSLWEHIPKEFDDYITKPKPNGYRSIHTAVAGENGKSFEIQIRTFEMHEEAERGVAAHWVYKEGKAESAYQAKVKFLRQLLDWHKDISSPDEKSPTVEDIFIDRVYIFTPAGDILDLPAGATPLDAAYHIHSEVGNHCRGAKVNGHIVPLTYHMQNGDQIEIMTISSGTPSRDWLNAEFGYLNTARARAKVAHYFRQEDLTQHIEQGKKILEREFARLNVHPSIQKLAHHFNFKDEDNFFAALGRGNLRLSQVTHIVETQSEVKPAFAPQLSKAKESKSSPMNIAGISDLLTRIARCCKPIPGDPIVGFITQGAGVTIHKKNCNNVTQLNPVSNSRLLEVSWGNDHSGSYYVDVQIRAHARDNLLKEVTTLLSNTKISLTNFNSALNRNNLLIITMTIQISALSQLQELMTQISHLKGVIEAKRVSQ